MSKDYYSILGVKRDADEDEIKKAYRRLAAKHHPDRGGSKEEFQRIEEAYRILSDPQQRHRHDAGGGHPFGAEFHTGNPGDFPGGSPFGFQFNFGGATPFDDLFNGIFRGGAPGGPRAAGVFRTTVHVTLEQVYSGGKQPLRFQTSSGSYNVSIDIPRGVGEGMQLRYDNLLPDGPLIVEFRTHQHLKFQRHGNDIHTNTRISVLELITGTNIDFTGLDGRTLSVVVPPGTQPTAALKINGAGLPQINTPHCGDAYLNLKPYTPDNISQELIEAILKHTGKV